MVEIKRITNFVELGLGIFLHYGLYNKFEKGEWYQDMYNLTSDQYYDKFNDLNNLELNIDLEGIVKFAKQNGFKYITLTSKHHDGFCLFDNNKISKFDVTSTKNKRDILREFLQLCKENEIKAFVYYATLDWSWDFQEVSFEQQLKKIYKHIELICKNYSDIYGFWFDGNWSKKEADWKEDRLYKMIRRYIPEAIIISNSGLINSGKQQNEEVDSVTYEQGHLDEIDYSKYTRHLAAEVCQSFNDHWGYAKEDYNYKTVKDLIYKFLSARKNKANYLLNLSIDKNGNLIPLEKDTVECFSNWVAKYGKFCLGEYNVIAKGENKLDFIVSKDGNMYIYLANIESGGHVNVIKKGGQSLEQRTFNFIEKQDASKYKDSFIFLDNGEIHKIDEFTNDMIKIRLKTFDYGFNTIFRVIEVKRREV